MNKPNIVLIMTDQQRWDTLGCLGYDHMITPHIDRLAARGVAFSHAFVQGAVCAAAGGQRACARVVVARRGGGLARDGIF
jgi:arylsulfatase A-like enzyme